MIAALLTLAAVVLLLAATAAAGRGPAREEVLDLRTSRADLARALAAPGDHWLRLYRAAVEAAEAGAPGLESALRWLRAAAGLTPAPDVALLWWSRTARKVLRQHHEGACAGPPLRLSERPRDSRTAAGRAACTWCRRGWRLAGGGA